MTVRICPKVSCSAPTSINFIPELKSFPTVIIERISVYMIIRAITNTKSPRITCSNHSYGVRPLACFRNTSSRNTRPPFWPSYGESVWSERAVCHANPLAQIVGQTTLLEQDVPDCRLGGGGFFILV